MIFKDILRFILEHFFFIFVHLNPSPSYNLVNIVNFRIN